MPGMANDMESPTLNDVGNMLVQIERDSYAVMTVKRCKL